MRTYFKENCSNQDKNFRAAISPFFTDTCFRNANNTIRHENGNIVNDPTSISELFDDYFSNVAMDSGFDDSITSVSDAVTPSTFHNQGLWNYQINIIRGVVLLLNKSLNPPLHCFCAGLIHVKLWDMTTFPVKSFILLLGSSLPQ